MGGPSKRIGVDGAQNQGVTGPVKTIAPPPTPVRQDSITSPGANSEALAHYGIALEKLQSGRRHGIQVAEYAGIPSFEEWSTHYLARMNSQPHAIAASSQRGNRHIVIKV